MMSPSINGSTRPLRGDRTRPLEIGRMEAATSSGAVTASPDGEQPARVHLSIVEHLSPFLTGRTPGGSS